MLLVKRHLSIDAGLILRNAAITKPVEIIPTMAVVVLRCVLRGEILLIIFLLLWVSGLAQVIL